MLDRQTIERAEAAAGESPILIALSGGGDSVALLHLLCEHCGATRLCAVVVDHALRLGSQADARRAAGFAEALGVAAEVVTLTWSEGESRSQQAARRKRYRALCETARQRGARVIAAAHTADDQAETVFKRAANFSAWRGLAGMAALASAPVWPEGRGLLLARPLLAARRADLRAYLRAHGAAWIEDPANTNPAYERVRVRARLAELERAGLDPMRFVRLADQLRALAERVEGEAAALIAAAVRFEDDTIAISSSHWQGDAEARRRALSVLIAAAAGAAREPDAAAIARLEQRLAADNFRGASLGGARLRRKGPDLILSPDPGAILGRAGGTAPLPPLALPQGVETVWDGRLTLTAAEPGLRLIPAPGAPGVQQAGVAVSLADLVARGAVSARWLLQQQVVHHLGPLSTTKLGASASINACAFTAP